MFLVFAFLAFAINLPAQKFSAEKTYIKFFSDATIEDIAAENTKASSIFNQETGDVVFSVPIKEFEFDKSLMKEHFNEKYMESEQYPKATFQGKISGYQTSTSGEQKATAAGKLTIHGVTQDVQIPGTMENIKGAWKMKAKFMVKLVDYKIKIPQLLWKNIAEEVEVTVEFNYKSL
ncbi:MAG: YceI family protein [Bacteroidetes bacterium]|nr:YceI family protein [Bacteroidota bacterium]MBI3482984.1 YceI family protein [Bacteroidota bacterium]